MLQTAVELADLSQQLDVFNGNGRELGQFGGDVFILLREIAALFIRELQKTDVLTFPADQRNSQPATDRVATNLSANVTPVRMGCQLGLGHAQWEVAVADHGLLMGCLQTVHQLLVARVGLWQGERRDFSARAAFVRHADHCPLRAQNHAHLFCGFAHRCIQCEVRGDGLGCFCCALQGMQLGLDLLLGLEVDGDILQRAFHAHDVAIRVAHSLPHGAHPDAAPGARQHLQLNVKGYTVFEASLSSSRRQRL